MKKRWLFCAVAAVIAAGLLVGCDGKKETKVLRDLPADFVYEIRKSSYTVNYTDSEGREISLFGELYEPVDGGKYPAVILSHGYNGHYTAFTSECRRFAQRGYICYSFDFCGAQENGESMGRASNEYTPLTMKEDILAIVKDLKLYSGVDSKQIFLFGGSQGGLVTALAAADEGIKDEIAGIAMYFPAFNIPDDWRGKPLVDSSPAGMGYVIGAKYIECVQDLDPYAVIGAYPKDVCIVWGDADAIVRREYIDRAVETYGADRVDLTVIEGAGHGFAGKALATAVDKVLTFFESHTYMT